MISSVQIVVYNCELIVNRSLQLVDISEWKNDVIALTCFGEQMDMKMLTLCCVCADCSESCGNDVHCIRLVLVTVTMVKGPCSQIGTPTMLRTQWKQIA